MFEPDEDKDKKKKQTQSADPFMLVEDKGIQVAEQPKSKPSGKADPFLLVPEKKKLVENYPKNYNPKTIRMVGNSHYNQILQMVINLLQYLIYCRKV